jgi:hypothetical protein
VFGIGTTAESLSDISLTLQTAQSSVNLITYDFTNNQLVFKASVPDDYIGTIYEVGLFSLEEDPNVTGFGSQLITTFDSQTEDWLDVGGSASVFDTVNVRVGVDSLSQTPALSTTKTDKQTGLALDLSGNSSSDSFTFAFNVGNSNTNAIDVLFLTDTSNYYTYSMGAAVQSSGYKIITANKGTATVTGTPSWDNITEIRVATTSKSSGASAVSFDAIRIEDKNSIDLDYILVARKVLASPVTKIDGQAQDIEFALDVTV